jgi:hypothetical protein
VPEVYWGWNYGKSQQPRGKLRERKWDEPCGTMQTWTFGMCDGEPGWSRQILSRFCSTSNAAAQSAILTSRFRSSNQCPTIIISFPVAGICDGSAVFLSASSWTQSPSFFTSHENHEKPKRT